MRIAMISTPFVDVPPRRYGGTELVVGALVEELVARGHEMVLYATGTSRTSARLRWHYERPRWPPDPAVELTHAAWAVEDLLRSEPVDLVHAHTASVLGFARLLDAPIVYTIHHVRDEGLSDLYRFARGPGVTMVAISERQRELMADALEARVVHHGLTADRYPLGDGGGGYAAFLGRFTPEKGVHVAIDVACRAGLPIRLAGRPHLADYYEQEIRPRLGQKGVSWHGEAGHDDKVRLLGGALATLFPIDWEEPFGLVMIESMLCGTPILAFGRGSTPELVDNGVTGWLVADRDEMAWRLRALVEQPFDRARCRARAAERFGARRMADEYLAIYEDVVGRPAASRTIVS